MSATAGTSSRATAVALAAGLQEGPQTKVTALVQISPAVPGLAGRFRAGFKQLQLGTLQTAASQLPDADSAVRSGSSFVHAAAEQQSH